MTPTGEGHESGHASGSPDRFRDAPFSRVEARVFLIALVLAVAARGAALFPLFYSIDTYIEVLAPSYHEDQYRERLSQGRFGQALLNEVLTTLGVSTPLTNTFYAMLCMICFVWAGLVVCRLWGAADHLILSLLVTSFIGLHPYQAELFTFNSTPIYTASAVFFAFVALYFSRGTVWRILWTGLCFTAALSLYQTSLNFVVLGLAFAVVLELARIRDGSSWRQVADRTRLWPRLMTLSFGLLLYLVINKAVQHAFHVVPATRAQFIDLSEVPGRLIEVRDVTIRIFALTEPLLPMAVKALLAVIGAIALFVGVRKVLSSGLDGTGKAFVLLLGAFLLLSAAACIMGVTLITRSWWPVPRILSAMSFFQAGLLALAFQGSGPKLRVVLLPISCIVLFAFIGINNHVFTDQLRVNLRDLHKASRIVDRMEDDPSFAQIQRVAVVGGNHAYPSPIYTAHGDLNISAFIAPWAKMQILNEVSGYSFGAASPEEQSMAARHCETASKWPAPGSVTVSGSLAIVCQ